MNVGLQAFPYTPIFLAAFLHDIEKKLLRCVAQRLTIHLQTISRHGSMVRRAHRASAPR
jgi:hypothetical protein